MENLTPKEQDEFRKLNNKIAKAKRDKTRKLPYKSRKKHPDNQYLN
jgi:hypothetical protein